MRYHQEPDPEARFESGNDIFDPAFVKGVFDRCGPRYRWWSQIASFGFVWIWRRQCVDGLPKQVRADATVVDLMAGTGETWDYLLRCQPQVGRIVAVDISSGMVRQAIDRLHRMPGRPIEVIEADILTEPLETGLADVVVCSFGLKTFNRMQQQKIAEQVSRILKPGGSFSFIEASDPDRWILRGVYRYYLRRILPMVERIFLQGAQDFAMIGIYTREFGDCRHFASCLHDSGLEVQVSAYFFGCATGVTGTRR